MKFTQDDLTPRQMRTIAEQAGMPVVDLLQDQAALMAGMAWFVTKDKAETRKEFEEWMDVPFTKIAEVLDDPKLKPKDHRKKS